VAGCDDELTGDGGEPPYCHWYTDDVDVCGNGDGGGHPYSHLYVDDVDVCGSGGGGGGAEVEEGTQFVVTGQGAIRFSTAYSSGPVGAAIQSKANTEAKTMV
jgi:hypothetical protein